ncbi:MAG TPA: phosphodiesterase [Chloroflexus aurantiacus]|jgi:predicted AlkP superfamily phosphohydrolase/phosphomutase|uniref:Type I phosphodiesterase/nucleotide pyrophosphatase n=1 Tax=Chloroflexus aurantiacus (strain ATCC 29366 / DSM 635 / J-10-fl) TaxID=324602 RepID=A9W9T5_CHLAA|nr:MULTISPECIES: alkaline phosphatase family protein [Chloroflexus]ABY34571.1 type I phosphodiesterase/nucleotide pyrophosphatase [Chloroflexus aurantiacus J-10-fl]RMG46789.1 MAG: phosphodiesterase [Chloroflexota bacterium]GIV93930.1 MAG: phosphodiesterase [Chloroflexus sp.]HBW66846.1 phosphodiesterase [Chloroflexus aurantiacus]
MTSFPRLLIIGLDSAEPSLVFERWRADLPTLNRLMAEGVYGELESCIPAITVPAWSCMMSGRDPGELGVYGFRNRVDRSYGRMVVADSRAIRFPRLWDILGDAGWRVAVIGVPGTYPPSAVNGTLVSCFLAPSTDATYTFPPTLAERLAAWSAEATPGHTYLLDVPDFRSDDKARIVRDIYAMCDQRFAIAEALIREERPDVLMLVDMGVDRIHHALWKHMDPQHPLFVPDSPFADAIHAYYRHVDTQIAALLAHCAAETAVLVVSDHGARPLMGGVRINQWLIAQGDLTLHTIPDTPTSLDQADVDWSRTRAWGAGGYYGRIFLNVRGREPQGVIPPAEYERVRTDLAARLEAMPGPDGRPLGNRVFVPQRLYRAVRGVAPDLIVYFGDLAWRAVGTVGGNGLFTRENDTGPDDANHAQHGLFIWRDPQRPGRGQRLGNVQIYDILPTLLSRFNIPIPAGLRGTVLEL